MRASYRHAIQWLADNDDTNWLEDENGTFSVATALVADLFGKHTDDVTKDLRRFFGKRAKETEKAWKAEAAE